MFVILCVCSYYTLSLSPIVSKNGRLHAQTKGKFGKTSDDTVAFLFRHSRATNRPTPMASAPKAGKASKRAFQTGHGMPRKVKGSKQ